MKQYWSCFLLSCSVVIAGLYGSGRVEIPESAELIVTLICLGAVQIAAGRFADDEDEAASCFFNKQRKRIACLVVLTAFVLYVVGWKNGLFVVCYTELVMFVSTLAQLGKEKLGNKENG